MYLQYVLSFTPPLTPIQIHILGEKRRKREAGTPNCKRQVREVQGQKTLFDIGSKGQGQLAWHSLELQFQFPNGLWVLFTLKIRLFSFL
jgi:hypothetical protein